MISKTIRRSLLAALVVAGAAHAHGERHGDGPAVEKEQMAWGIAGDPGAATRTVEIAMGDDMRFRPDRIEVRQGETVRIVHRNLGRVRHEFVLGTRASLDGHAALMKKFPAMEHDEPYIAHVGPGRSGQIVWTFNRAGRFDFACLIPGHYDAGMVGAVVVHAAAPGAVR